MTTHNRPEIPFALSRMFGIKGEWHTDLEANINPNIQVGDVTATPYLDYGVSVGNGTIIAANAAEFGYVVAIPDASRIFQAIRVRVQNDSGAAFEADLRVFSATQLASLGTVINSARVNRMVRSESGVAQGTTLVRTFRAATGTVGDLIDFSNVPAGGNVLFDLILPGGCVFGNIGGGIGVSCRTVNTAMGANFMGKEWPLPG